MLAAREALAAEPGAGAAAKADVGRSLIAVAGLLEATGKSGEAMAAYRRSESLLAGLGGGGPVRRGPRWRNAGRCWAMLLPHGSDRRGAGRLPAGAGRPGGAGRRPRGPGRARRDLADTLNRIGILLAADRADRRRRKPSTARRWRSGRSWPTTTPPSPTFRSSLAISHSSLGILLAERAGRRRRRPSPPGAGDPAEAGRRQPRRHRVPQPVWRPATTTSATLLSQTGKLKEAEAEYRAALAIHAKLADDNPAVTEFRSRLASIHNNLGVLLSQTGKPAEAEAEYRAALAIHGSWPTKTPPSPTSAAAWRSQHNLGDSCRGRAGQGRRRPSTAGRW